MNTEPQVSEIQVSYYPRLIQSQKITSSIHYCHSELPAQLFFEVQADNG